MPEHRIQRKQPKFQLAHRGSFFLQSTQTLLSADLTKARSILAFASVCCLDCVTRDMADKRRRQRGAGAGAQGRGRGRGQLVRGRSKKGVAGGLRDSNRRGSEHGRSVREAGSAMCYSERRPRHSDSRLTPDSQPQILPAEIPCRRGAFLVDHD